MPEDFDPSPRASKRRRVSTYGSSRSTRSEKNTPVSSIWENVSSSVTGLSRRLFVGNKSSQSPDDSTYASQEDSPVDEEAPEDTGKILEIAESESELVDTTLVELRRSNREERLSDAQTTASKIITKMVNVDSGKAPTLHRKIATGLKKRKSGTASRSALGRPPGLTGDTLTNTADDTLSEVVTADAEDDSITLQPRSSGRQRKRTRKYSIETVEIQETPKSTTHSTSTTGAVKQKPGGTKKTNQLALIGILTPSKRNEKKARKSVVFDESEKQMETEFGFKDISSSTKKSPRPALEPQQISTPSKSRKKSKQAPREDVIGVEPDSNLDVNADEDTIFDSPPTPVPILEEPALPQDETDFNEDSPELQHIKATVLTRLTHRAAHTERPSLPSHLKGAYDTLYTLLRTTVVSGESNSLLLLGSRGAGKSLLVNTALGSLRQDLSTEFHTVRLNGFVQTDDRLALREIWRQLGREMEVAEDETNQVVGSYADTMTSLLGLLSQPEEVPDIGAVEYVAEKIVTKSVVFVLDEFDLFTTHPRQTLLYNLFDIAQSRKAPIAVIGCSARTDCVECLEKRVKSRFSHRWVHVSQPKNLASFEEVARDNLLVDEKRIGSTVQEQEWAVAWNEYIKVGVIPTSSVLNTNTIQSTFLKSSSIQSLISSIFYTTKSLPDLFAALYLPVAGATISTTPVSNPSSDAPSLLSLLPSLPHIHLALLVCATRLEAIHSLTQLNFNIVYAHYTDLLTKSRLAASASGATASGMRWWGRDVSLRAWEELVHWEVLVRVGGKDEGMGEEGRMYRIDVSIEEVRWAVEGRGMGVGEGLARWCREI